MQVRVVVLDKDDNNPRFLESNLTLGVRVNAPIYTELTKEHKTSNYILHILKPREIIIVFYFCSQMFYFSFRHLLALGFVKNNQVDT